MKGPIRLAAAALLLSLFACADDTGAPMVSETDTDAAGSSSSSGEPDPPSAEELLFSDQLLNIAHAGGKGTRPEHTMIAYETALADGANVLELDVHATSDGVLVVLHDETVDRTTDGSGVVAEMTFAELQQLDAGYTFTADEGATYPYRGMGLTIPSVEEVLMAHPDVPYVIEIKQASPSIVEPLLQMCDAHEIQDQMVVSGFDVDVMTELRAARPGLPTGFALPEVLEFMGVTPDTEGSYVPPGAFLQVPIEQAGIPVLTEAFVERAHRLELKVHAWTINDETEMRDLVALGVDGIITDFPARLRDL